jgi:hypothetical protein
MDEVTHTIANTETMMAPAYREKRVLCPSTMGDIVALAPCLNKRRGGADGNGRDWRRGRVQAEAGMAKGGGIETNGRGPEKVSGLYKNT